MSINKSGILPLWSVTQIPLNVGHNNWITPFLIFSQNLLRSRIVSRPWFFFCILCDNDVSDVINVMWHMCSLFTIGKCLSNFYSRKWKIFITCQDTCLSSFFTQACGRLQIADISSNCIFLLLFDNLHPSMSIKFIWVIFNLDFTLANGCNRFKVSWTHEMKY